MKEKITFAIIVSVVLLFVPFSKTRAARLWSSGFELQSVANSMEWDTTTGSPTIDNTTKRSGAASLRCNTSSATAYIKETIHSDTEWNWYIRAYVNFTSFPSGLTRILSAGDSGGGIGASIQVNSDGTLELWDNDETHQIGSDSSPLETGTWYRIELNFNDSSNTADGRIDGASFASGSTGELGGGNVFSVGVIESATMDVHFDDIAVNDDSGSYQNSWPGAGSIIHLYPNAAGDTDTFASGDYTSVDEKPTPDDATSYAEAQAAGQILETATEDSSVAGIESYDMVTLVQVGLRHVTYCPGSCSGSITLRPRIKSQTSGTVLEGTSFTHNDSTWKTNGDNLPKTYKLTSYVDPEAGGAWTSALLDTTQIGVTMTATGGFYGRISSMWALVEYVPGVPPLSSSPVIIKTPTGSTVFKRNVIFK